MKLIRHALISFAVVATIAFGLFAPKISLARHGRGAPTAAQPVNMMGANLTTGGTGSLTYNNLPLFQDRVFESAGFQTTGGGVVTTNAAGWPTADFQLLMNIDAVNVPQP